MIASIYRQKLLFVVLLMALFAAAAQGQNVAVRNNLLYDATLTPNLGIETRLDSTWSLGLNAGLNAWDIDKEKNKKWRHVMLSPFVRHYNDTIFQRSFWGLHGVYSHYNVSGVRFPLGLYPDVRHNRRQGDLVALGGSYGYNWRLSGRLHLEAEAGLALGYTWYEDYACATCGAYYGKKNNLFLLPKLGLNLVWTIGPKPAPKAVPVVIDEPVVPEVPVVLAVHDVAENTGRAGLLEHDNPVLQHISQYRPYDNTRILRKEKGALWVNFAVGSSTLTRDYRDNAATLDRIVAITRDIMADSTSAVKRIQIVGLASIEGPVARNEKLSQQRAEALKDYIQQMLPDVDDSLFDLAAGGEAWTELRDQLGDAVHDAAGDGVTPDDMKKALEIIDAEGDPSRRERQLQRLNGGRTFSYIRQKLLPEQRNSGYLRIYYDYVPDEAAAVINRASELLRTDCDECHREALDLLTTVSHDERAQNALGVALYMAGRYDEARECFERAAQNGNADARENLRQLHRQLER